MAIDAPLGLLIAAVVVCGIAVGASLDQSIKQLPARHRVGVLAYSDYSQVADVRRGLFWYVPLGVAWTVLNVAAAIAGWADGATGGRAIALGVLVAGVVGHILLTGFAAPAVRSQHTVAGDEQALRRIFDRFERLQVIRAALDVAALAAAVWALAATIAEGPTAA
jgi:hypothetical protein